MSDNRNLWVKYHIFFMKPWSNWSLGLFQSYRFTKFYLDKRKYTSCERDSNLLSKFEWYLCVLNCKTSEDHSILMWDFRFSRRRVWSLESSEMWRRVVTLKWTDVSDVLTASIIRAMNRCFQRTQLGRHSPPFYLRAKTDALSKPLRSIKNTGQWPSPEPR
jgi:hypothetical protein